MLLWLMIVHLLKNYSRLVSYILQPNANCKGCTALHYAALVDDSTSVEELLKAGNTYFNLTLTVKDAQPCTMLPWLMIVHLSKNYSRLVSYILQPNTNCKGCTALHYAALVDDSTSVEELLKAGKLHTST